MTNPPFSGTIKEKEILRNFPNLAYKKGKIVSKIGRHILFIERSLQFLRSGGRMAIVIPQGVLNNVNTEYLRRYVIQEAKILGVIGLHVNSFKPHTGTKTSILLLQKFSDEEIQKKEELKIKFVGEWEQYFEELKKKMKIARLNS